MTTFARKNYFLDIYVLKKDVDLKNIILQPTETIDAKWSSHEEIEQMIEKEEFAYTVGVRYGLYKDKVTDSLDKNF